MADQAFVWDHASPLKRQKGESTQAAQALHDYALLGQGRSLSQLLEVYRDQSETEARPTTRPATLKAWSSRYAWQARVARFDELERERDRVKWEKRRDAYRERIHELATGKGLERIEEMLDYPLTRQVVTQRDEDGRPTVVEIKPVRWSIHSAATLFTALNNAARLTLGEATERVESETTVVSANPYSNLSNEDLDDAIAQLESRAHASREGALRAPAFREGSAPRDAGSTGARDGEGDGLDYA